MKERIEITCTDCEGVFTVEHDLDPQSYNPTHCVFCGEPLDDEYVTQFEYDEDEEEWNEKR